VRRAGPDVPHQGVGGVYAGSGRRLLAKELVPVTRTSPIPGSPSSTARVVLRGAARALADLGEIRPWLYIRSPRPAAGEQLLLEPPRPAPRVRLSRCSPERSHRTSSPGTASPRSTAIPVGRRHLRRHAPLLHAASAEFLSSSTSTQHLGNTRMRLHSSWPLANRHIGLTDVVGHRDHFLDTLTGAPHRHVSPHRLRCRHGGGICK